MDIEFSSLKELYDRIKPALTTKKNELKKIGYTFIKEADIWNYLTQTKWLTSKELTLSEMVSDIFSAKEEDINKYMIDKISKEKREPSFDE